MVEVCGRGPEKGALICRLIVKRASHYGHTMNDMTGLSMAMKPSDGKNRLRKLELKRGPVIP